MKGIILCAGEGKRMYPLTIPKCLLKYKDITFLQRLINQLKTYGVEDIFVVVGYHKKEVVDSIKDTGVNIVYDDRKHPDTSVYSVFLAMESIGTADDLIILDGDIILEDELMRYVTGTDFENESVFFTRGKFEQNQSGGILKTNGYGTVIDIKVVDKYDSKYEDYDKTTGIIRVAKNVFNSFSHMLNRMKLTENYYFMSWKDCLVKGDASFYAYDDFNTIDKYKKIGKMNFDFSCKLRAVYLMNINKLFPIEKYDSARIDAVRKGVINNGSWIVPLKIQKQNNLVLDGHHSLQLAKQMGLKRVPVMSFCYDEVDMWSLREILNITKEDVIKNAGKGDLYPTKTVKHRFPNVVCDCAISLEELK